MYLHKGISLKTLRKIFFCGRLEGHWQKRAGSASGSVSHKCGSGSAYGFVKNVTDPKLWHKYLGITVTLPFPNFLSYAKLLPVSGEVHSGESLGDEVDREVGAAHPQVTDEVARLVHAFHLHREKHKGQVSYLFLEFRIHNFGLPSFEAVFGSVSGFNRIRICEGKNDPQK
jgi:hypothetical protein